MQKLNKQVVVAFGVIEYGNKVLLLRRIDSEPMWHHKWEFPGGKVDAGETPLQAVIREIKEETGLDVINPELLGVYTGSWDRGEYTQQNFMLGYRVHASTQHVVLNSAADDDYRWVTVEEFMRMEDHIRGNKEMFEELYLQHIRKEVVQ